MPGALQTLYIALTGDSSGLTKEMKEADKSVKKTSEGLKKLGKRIAQVFAVVAIKRWVQATAQAANESVRMARNLGVSVKEARELQFVAKATGLSMAVIEDAAFEIKKRFGEIRVNKPFAKLMRSLGLSEKKAAGMSSVELMFETVERIAKGPAADIEKRLDLAFGGGAAKGFTGLTKDAKLLAAVLESRNKVRGIGAAGEEFQAMQVTVALLKSHLEAVSIELLAKILPYAAKFADWLMLNLDQIVKIGGWVVAVGAAIYAVVKTVMALKAVFAAVAFIAGVISAPVWGIVAAVVAVIAVVATLFTYWEDIWGIVKNVGGVIGKFLGPRLPKSGGAAYGNAPAPIPGGYTTTSNTTNTSTQNNSYTINAEGMTPEQTRSMLKRDRDMKYRGVRGGR